MKTACFPIISLALIALQIFRKRMETHFYRVLSDTFISFKSSCKEWKHKFVSDMETKRELASNLPLRYGNTRGSQRYSLFCKLQTFLGKISVKPSVRGKNALVLMVWHLLCNKGRNRVKILVWHNLSRQHQHKLTLTEPNSRRPVLCALLCPKDASGGDISERTHQNGFKNCFYTNTKTKRHSKSKMKKARQPHGGQKQKQ